MKELKYPKIVFTFKNGNMAEATIKMEGIEVNIKSEIFSEKFMKLVKTIESFDLSKNVSESTNKQINTKKLNSPQAPPATMDIIHYMSDIDVMDNVQRVIKIAKEHKIEEYYNEKIEEISDYLKTYKHGTGFTNNNARVVLKSILRKCLEFSKTDYFKNQIPK